MEKLPENWKSFLQDFLDEKNLEDVLDFIAKERTIKTIFPPEGEIFTALRLTQAKDVKVVIIGQDPYHDNNQAHGLAFSVPEDEKIPPSLRNIFKEYSNDLGYISPDNGSLLKWAENSILLLNAVLSVEAHKANSHKDIGWEKFTDSIISSLSQKSEKIVFILWGNYAQSKKILIDENKHLVLTSVHPSPLSAHRGFFGSSPFSKAENFLSPWSWPKLTNKCDSLDLFE